MPRILIADDDADIRDIVRACISLDGHEVTLAVDGFEALAQMRTMSHDVVVLDNSMPVMSGLEVLAATRDLDEGRRPWVLMLSALASRSDIRMGFNAGADDYMAKPFSCAELRTRVNALCDERALFFPTPKS